MNREKMAMRKRIKRGGKMASGNRLLVWMMIKVVWAFKKSKLRGRESPELQEGGKRVEKGCSLLTHYLFITHMRSIWLYKAKVNGMIGLGRRCYV
ncbi:MAG: hypothetical protein CSB13_07705 [Chloroflexi bacterium]|nr:MAG: hypothetical protein CSB13_07705 [Chloroflexota bacterium]